MIGDLLKELNTKSSVIKAEYGRSEDEITARSVAESFGYEFWGVGCGKGPYPRYMLFLARQTGVDTQAYHESLRRLREEGYSIRPITVTFQTHGDLNCDMVLSKQYAERSRVGVMERSSTRTEIAALGYRDGTSLFCVFLDTRPEHVGLVEELADYMGLGQNAESQVPEAFRDFIRGLDF